MITDAFEKTTQSVDLLLEKTKTKKTNSAFPSEYNMYLVFKEGLSSNNVSANGYSSEGTSRKIVHGTGKPRH